MHCFSGFPVFPHKTSMEKAAGICKLNTAGITLTKRKAALQTENECGSLRVEEFITPQTHPDVQRMKRNRSSQRDLKGPCRRHATQGLRDPFLPPSQYMGVYSFPRTTASLGLEKKEPGEVDYISFMGHCHLPHLVFHLKSRRCLL